MSERCLKLLLIDDDRIFGLGLKAILSSENPANIEVVAQVCTVVDILKKLSEENLDLVVINYNLAKIADNDLSGIEICELINTQCPNLPIFLLTDSIDSQELEKAKLVGVKGYCLKRTDIVELIEAFNQVSNGGEYWQSIISSPKQNQDKFISTTLRKTWLTRQCQSGIEQIEENLAHISLNLENSEIPLIDWLFWQGRTRELLVARWIINQFLPIEVIKNVEKYNIESEKQISIFKPALLDAVIANEKDGYVEPSSQIFLNTLKQLQFNLDNFTGGPLEIDILQRQKKQELLYVVLNKLKTVIEELKFLKITSEQLKERIEVILQELWLYDTLEIVRKYYLIEFQVNETDLLNIILLEKSNIKQEVFDKIPWLLEIFSYLIFKETFVLDGVTYRHEAPEAIERVEILLQNLIITLANAVMQTILNNFYNLESFKYYLYDQEKNSSREIASFRNNLTGKYRLEKYWQEPKNIFEDKYSLYRLEEGNIKKIFIYASRKEELNQLKGLQWAITVVIEVRDALTPGLRAIVDFTGKGLVYLLTEIIGRGLGLIGRGIIQGVGNSLQESRYKKNSEKGK